MPEPLTLEGLDSDPRPEFSGSWAKADGKTRQAHMTRVAAWKARHGIVGERGGKASSDQPQSQAQSREEGQASHLGTLKAIIDTPNSLASDRIRAVEARERILRAQAEEATLEAHGPLVALGEALRALPIEERVEALSSLLTVEG